MLAWVGFSKPRAAFNAWGRSSVHHNGRMTRNLALLALCQALFLTNNVTFIAINGLVGLQLAPLGWMATLPVMGYVVGGALSALIRRGESGARGVRFCRAEQLHVTLRFLGEVAPETVGQVSAVVALAARLVEPFSLHFSGLGAFPMPHAPRPTSSW